MRTKSVIAGALALATATAGIAIGAGSDENVSGAVAERASDAALAATGGGKVLEVERGDDDGAAYEVEVRTKDGDVSEVLLDADLGVVRIVGGNDD